MDFKLPIYKYPNFNKEPFISSPNVKLVQVEIDGVAPDNYHATTMFPEYFKINGAWVLAKESRMDCVAVVKDDGTVEIKEFRNLKIKDKVVVERAEDGRCGVFVYTNGFIDESSEMSKDIFSFRSGRSRETSYTKDYEELCNILEYEKQNGGYIVWVLGPAAVFSKEARDSMSKLIENRYVNVLFGGNAVATHDLEAAIYNTALGQDVYTQESKKDGHYHHIDVINKARKYKSIEKLIEKENIKDGIIYSCIKNNVPIVLAGSIRDDGPLPIVIENVYDAQDAMRHHVKKATTVICVATQLHSIATGNMTPCYKVREDESIRPVFLYSIDISEFAVNKLIDRGSLGVKTIVTNVQDFLGKLRSNLVDNK